MIRAITIGLVLLAGSVWAATLSCPAGILSQAQTAQGASTNTFHDDTKRAIGFHAHINAGTATVVFQICCRTILGPTGCDEDDEWFTLNGGTFALDFVAGPASGVAGPTDMACMYRSFISNGTCAACNVDTTFQCTAD